VDEISKTILDQAKDFLSADKHTCEDIIQIKEGLQKVEFVRSKNYLSKLAILISRQENEIAKLQKKAEDLKACKIENTLLKEQIQSLNSKLAETNNWADTCQEDKNFMMQKV
jgi:uncharacterized protein YigA (DUF484 family)